MITALTELDSLERMDVKITQQRVDLPNFIHVLNKTILFFKGLSRELYWAFW